MDSPEHVRSYSRRDSEDISDVKGERDVDDEEYEGNDRRKHQSSKTRKPSNGEDTEGLGSSGRRRSSGDRSENRKRTSGSSRADSDEDDFDAKRDRSKQLKKSKEESSLEKLSSWYQDGDIDGGDKLGGRGHGRRDEPERRRVSSKFSDHDSSQSKHRSREERYNDGEPERMLDKDSRYSERRESSREKVQGSSENVKTPRKKWDESDAAKKTEENGYDRVDLRSGKSSDSKHESGRERSTSTRVEQGDGRSGDIDSNNEKAFKSCNKEERKVDTDRTKGKGKVESQEDDFRSSPRAHEERPDKEKNDKYRQQRTPPRYDIAESRERSFNSDENGSGWSRDKNVKELGHSNRSRTPERSSRKHQDTELSEMDNDRNIIPKRKEVEKDSYRDDRSKGRDGSWSERNRDREGSSDSWKRRQPPKNDKDAREGGNFYEHGREWEIQRHGHERNDNERHHGRSGGRKDGNRGEAVKTSSNFGISNENYDVIEIQTKPIDYVRTDSGSAFSRRGEGGQFSEPKSVANDDQRAYTREAGRSDMYGSGPSSDDLKEQNTDDGTPTLSQAVWRDENEMQGSRGRGQKAPISTGLQSPFGSQDQGSFNRVGPQGMKGNRVGRGGRGRTIGRDNQQVGIPLPIMGSPFGPLGMPPPGPMASLNPNMSPAPGPPMSPSVFMPPFSPPVVWPGARGMDMNMLAIPPGLSPVPPGPSGPRFQPSMGTPPTSAMYFNQAVSGRGVPSNMTGPGINAVGQGGRGGPHDKASGSWVPPKSSGPPGKAPSRGEQNDYSQNFVDTGMRPQNFIRELELTNVVEDYPKLRELIQKKDDIVRNSNTAPMYYKCDLREHVLSSEFFGTKFDVILVDPPWEEYVHRAPGLADHMEYWTFEEIMNLKIEAIADTPSFIFLWVGDGVGLEQGRQCLKKWGFRRCEDICWVKTNKNNSTPSLRHDSHTLFQHSKEHCLMGIKGTVRRSTDGHIIHANIDTDVIIAEEPDYGSTKKPEDMYRIVEHFSLGRRRLELFGEDHNIRPGWLTVGKGLSSSNFNVEAYIKNFCDKDGKVWLGGGGRNPPPESPHLVLTTPDIEALRPKSPMKNQQQLQQQQSTAISINTNSSGKRPTGNSPQNPSLGLMNQEASGSNTMNPGPWAPPMDGFKGGNMGPEEKLFESMYGYNAAFMQASGEYMDFEAHRAMNLL